MGNKSPSRKKSIGEWGKGKACPNGKCFTTKHHQTLFADQTCWCWGEWPSGWDMFDQTMNTSRWASVVRMRAPNNVDTAVQTNKTSPIKHKKKRNVLRRLMECLVALRFYQRRPNAIKQRQTRCQNGKMFGQQTMFGAWSPNSVWTGLNAKTYSPQVSPLLFKGQKSFVIVVNGILKRSTAVKTKPVIIKVKKILSYLYNNLV